MMTWNKKNFQSQGGRNQDEDKDDITRTEPTNMEEEEEEVLKEIQGGGETTATRSEQVSSRSTRLIKEMGACLYKIGLSATEEEYYNTMWKMSKMALDSAGIGGGFIDTSKLHVMKFKEAMAGKDSDKWQKAFDKEHEHMQKHCVWKLLPIKEVPKGSKMLTTTLGYEKG